MNLIKRRKSHPRSKPSAGKATRLPAVLFSVLTHGVLLLLFAVCFSPVADFSVASRIMTVTLVALAAVPDESPSAPLLPATRGPNPPAVSAIMPAAPVMKEESPVTVLQKSPPETEPAALSEPDASPVSTGAESDRAEALASASLPDSPPGAKANDPAAFIRQTAAHAGPERWDTWEIKASPRYNLNPAPDYPATARHRGYEGLVLLTVLVDREGHVSDVQIAQSSGHAILDQAALRAVRTWLFKPAQKGNKIIEDRVRVPIRFQLH